MANMLGSTPPVSHDLSNTVPITLGTRFEPEVPLSMTHYRWYVPATAQPGGAVVEFSLWDNATETILHTQTYDTSGDEDSFIEVAVDSGPYALSSGVEYTVSVWVPDRFVSTPSVTWTDYGTPGVVTCPSTAGLYRYNVPEPFYPTDDASSSNYFIDMVYDVPTGPTVAVWNGTTEVPATVTVWNGTTEVAASVDSIA